MKELTARRFVFRRPAGHAASINYLERFRTARHGKRRAEPGMLPGSAGDAKPCGAPGFR